MLIIITAAITVIFGIFYAGDGFLNFIDFFETEDTRGDWVCLIPVVIGAAAIYTGIYILMYHDKFLSIYGR